MVNISVVDNTTCCGCEACSQICPKHCITMSPDCEGFLYPNVSRDSCIECGLCGSVCPMIGNSETEHIPQIIGYSKNPDSFVRKDSSSGGIFSILAETVIQSGGVVFGAIYDKNWNVEHVGYDTTEKISSFRGSKYSQSHIGSSYKDVKEILKSGRRVLFSGVPCQILALKKFLKKDYENLILVDVVCHSVPSPSVWLDYLKEISRGKQILSVNFRDKKHGWSNYHVTITLKGKELSSLHYHNPFMRGYLNGLFDRPSCSKCPTKPFKGAADITLGDLWGAGTLTSGHDDTGLNLIMINTEKGSSFLAESKIIVEKLDFDKVISYNPAIYKKVCIKDSRAKFFSMTGSVSSRVAKLAPLPFKARMRQILNSFWGK